MKTLDTRVIKIPVADLRRQGVSNPVARVEKEGRGRRMDDGVEVWRL